VSARTNDARQSDPWRDLETRLKSIEGIIGSLPVRVPMSGLPQLARVCWSHENTHKGVSGYAYGELLAPNGNGTGIAIPIDRTIGEGPQWQGSGVQHIVVRMPDDAWAILGERITDQANAKRICGVKCATSMQTHAQDGISRNIGQLTDDTDSIITLTVAGSSRTAKTPLVAGGYAEAQIDAHFSDTYANRKTSGLVTWQRGMLVPRFLAQPHAHAGQLSNDHQDDYPPTYGTDWIVDHGETITIFMASNVHDTNSYDVYFRQHVLTIKYGGLNDAKQYYSLRSSFFDATSDPWVSPNAATLGQRVSTQIEQNLGAAIYLPDSAPYGCFEFRTIWSATLKRVTKFYLYWPYSDVIRYSMSGIIHGGRPAT
jgi:hypothetical protein